MHPDPATSLEFKLHQDQQNIIWRQPRATVAAEDRSAVLDCIPLQSAAEKKKSTGNCNTGSNIDINAHQEQHELSEAALHSRGVARPCRQGQSQPLNPGSRKRPASSSLSL
ncbi:hypothetical protein Nepgr_022929 [Nepenthes gracilis]|uniref:Uncharacterized protein n=1 Tax=Nepenthes gracilis TaxID=150966 RepID=A0AAD3XX93_NEPGR|nr:hypothetical protein Nepgr_022929 [Nepenthes gracilis]